MLDATLQQWLVQQADALHAGQPEPSHALLKHLAAADCFRHGVPTAWGGLGDPFTAAIETIADLAEYSFTAAFVCWSQRTYIEYILHTEAVHLRETLADLLTAKLAGATALSNAMKFLSGLEPLQIHAVAHAEGWALTGKLPWVSNFHPDGFSVAVAADSADGAQLFIVESTLAGFTRHADLDLIGLRGSATAAASLKQVQVDSRARLSDDAVTYLQHIRPAFLALQCGLAIGLTRRCLQQVQANKHAPYLLAQAEQLSVRLSDLTHKLYQGLLQKIFIFEHAQLFQLRIALSALSQQAIQLELSSAGGKAYLHAYDDGFARRFIEAAFIPIVTPSIVQLQSALLKTRSSEMQQ
ncbi:acyl-CoA dehydrogenase family protein [Acinetobacter larvae]|uniref:Acyl-CoA dehydrogenase n=1 Tax=Acinetobacter larvae TaxID=1789224 RepID=A0A1B2M2Q0_9GAMM|nr:acyl-CoA dehydrogenase family protein [Acinetobacter larvae]AOA59467.1 hypothetical protein BFG52_14665 [Acinetobacter larvae]